MGLIPNEHLSHQRHPRKCLLQNLDRPQQSDLCLQDGMLSACGENERF